MSKLRRDLKEQPIPIKVTEGARLINACTGNTAIGDVAAELTAFTAVNTQLGADNGNSEDAADEASRLLDVRDTTDGQWNVAFENLLQAAEKNTKGEKAKLDTLPVPNYEPGRAPAVGAPAKVTGVATSHGDNPGDVEVTWNGNRPKPLLYLLRMCEGPFDRAKMQQIATPSGSRHVVPGLTLGKEYWFELCAVGSNNQQGPWSEPARAIAG